MARRSGTQRPSCYMLVSNIRGVTMKKFNVFQIFLLFLFFSLSLDFPLLAQTNFSTNDLSGTWQGYENGNRITLKINQNGNSFTGYLSFVDNPRQQDIPIKGTISTSITAWKIYKVEWKRIDENHTYIGYTFSMGHGAGRGIAGYFHRPLSNGNMEPEGNMGWYVTK